MARLKALLSKIDKKSLTTDLWKNKKLRYFLTLTAHFHAKDYSFHSMVVSFRKFSKNHTAKNITEFINKELESLAILEKIISITTDNEASVVAACSKLSDKVKRISCFNHNLNLIVKNGLKLWMYIKV
jgi:hypothetical protein